jgi:hypothetical protein
MADTIKLDKIEFKNLPSGNTPVNDENLNTVQDNVEKFGNVISTNAAKKDKELEDTLVKQEKELNDLKLKHEQIMKDYEKKTVQGSSIHINDSLEYDMPISINGGIEQDTREGYNKFDSNKIPNDTLTTGGVTFSKVENGGIKANGTSTGDKSTTYFGVSTNETLNDIPIVVGKKLYVSAISTNTKLAFAVYIMANGTYYELAVVSNNEKEITIPEGSTTWLLRVVNNGATGQVFNNDIIYPMISETSGKPYEQFGSMPSIDFPSEVKGVSGHYDTVVENKNLVENNLTSKTINGLDVVVNNDKTIIINGTATATTVLNLINDEIGTNASERILKKGTYTLSGCPSGGGGSTNYKLDINTPTGPFMGDIGNKITSTFEEDKTYTGIRIVIYSGCVCNNLTFKPMLEKGKVATDYTPHQEQLLPIDIPFNMYSGKPYKENGKWYRPIEWERKVYNGTENWLMASDNNFYIEKAFSSVMFIDNMNYCNMAKFNKNLDYTRATEEDLFTYQNLDGVNIRLWVNAKSLGFTTVEEWKNYLANNNLVIVKRIATPTIEEITDTTLIKQLEALEKADSYDGVTNVNSYGNEDVAPLVLSGEYVRSNKHRIENIEKAILSLSADV